ncbi:MAG: DUF1643 domain-containing protein [Sphingomonadaceae bacterium]|nr:DUF1643 domain-containing protein [Sphingomonadaceae bacterium]
MSDLFSFASSASIDVSPSPLRSAIFSECRRWRYVLRIVWDVTKPLLVALMLNPSTADEIANDPTVERLERRSRALGFGTLIVINLYAARATDPRHLYRGVDPVGPGNDEALSMVAAELRERGGMLLCGWGAHGARVRLDRPRAVLSLFRGIVPHALSVNADGSPQHPLYVAYECRPAPFTLGSRS